MDRREVVADYDRARMHAALDDLDAARALLRELEWRGDPIWELWNTCSICDGIDPSQTERIAAQGPAHAARLFPDGTNTIGHAPGCRLAALIGSPTR